MLAYSFLVSTGPAKVSSVLTPENYNTVLATPAYLTILARTVLITAESVPIALILSYPISYYIVRTQSSLARRSLLVVVVSMFFVSDIVRAYTFIPLLGRDGILNQVLSLLGLPHFPNLYSSTSIAIGISNFLVPFAVLVLLGSLKAIDPNLEHAARSLGAGSIRTFIQITFPLSLPGIAYTTIICIALSMGAFVTPLILGGGYILEISNFIYTQMTANFDYPLASAASFLLLSVTFILSFGLSKYFQRNLKEKWGV